MRPGTRVQRFTIDRCDAVTGHELHAPEGPIGTVFDCAQAWRSPISIRWDDGRIEVIDPRDESADLCLDDVTPRLFVNVYLWDGCYGGPEEGGWYYDAYAPEPEHCSQHATEEAAEAWAAKIEWGLWRSAFRCCAQ